MKYNFCTLFDKNYLVRAVTLYQSVEAHMPESIYWFLCLDRESENILKKLNLRGVHTISLNDLHDDELLAVKNSRTRAEFAFTAKSAFLNFIIQTKSISDGDVLVWSDADILFYSSLHPVIDDMLLKTYSIGITPHNFREKYTHLNEKVGRYNAGFVVFIVNDTTRQCVSDWRKQCIEKCTLNTDKGYVGDQMYINDWSKTYSGVYEIANKGVNLGPWNIGNYTITTERMGGFLVDTNPIICYHFHGLHLFIEKDGGTVSPLPISIYHDALYGSCARAVTDALSLVHTAEPDFQFGFAKRPQILKQIKQRIQRFIREVHT